MENTVAVQTITAALKANSVITVPFAAEPEAKLVLGCRIVNMAHRLLLLNTRSRGYTGGMLHLVEDATLAKHYAHLDVL